MRTAVRAVALATVLVLAGCSGTGGLGGGASSAGGDTTPTLTPVAVPEATATAGGDRPASAPTRNESQLAPGLTADGVTDADVLAAAHLDALDAVSFTIERNFTERDADGSLLTATVTRAAVGPEGRRYRYARDETEVLDGERRVVRTLRFSDGTVVHQRLALSGATDQPVVRDRVDDAADTSAGLPGGLRGGDDIARFLGTVETTVVDRIERGETVLYRVESTGPADPPSTRFRNVSVTALVEDSGFVREYRLSYAVEQVGTGPVHVSGTVRFTSVGTTEIRRPSWVGNGSSPTASASPALSHPGSPPSLRALAVPDPVR